ncbi:MAG: nucleotidyltransferase [Ignavibacteriaceae bacterium]
MFSQDFKEFIELLNKNKIEYLVVGGYAVGIHGYPRYTGDIDIWIKISNEIADKMVSVLDEFGFGGYEIKREDFLNSNNVIQLGYPPLRIDIIMSIDGVNFEESYSKRVEKVIDGMPINFIGFEELIKNKRASGRDKDIIDLKNLT